MSLLNPCVLVIPILKKKVISTYLNATFCMLTWTKEKRAINQWIPIEHQQLFLTQHAMYPGAPLGGQSRQDETARIIISVVAFILRL